MEEEGRTELANDLARVLTSKGVALKDLGRLPEALGCYEEAEGIYRRSVEEGRTELANDLARVLMNKGVALSNLDRILEARKCFKEGEALYRRLVEEEGRTELTNDWATVLMDKGEALHNLGRFSEAIECYNKSIGMRERMVKAGMTHVVPNLVRGLRVRFSLHQEMGDWAAAAEDAVSALTYAQPLLQSGEPPETLLRELERLRETLQDLSDEEWAQLMAALGKRAEMVREFMRRS